MASVTPLGVIRQAQLLMTQFNSPHIEQLKPEIITNKTVSCNSSTSEGNDINYQNEDSKEFCELEIKKYFPRKAVPVLYETLSPRVQRIVDLNPHYFIVSYQNNAKERKPEVILRFDLDVNRLTFNSCRQALMFDLEWLGKSHCVTDTAISDAIFVAPMYFVPPRCVLACGLQGNMTSERLIYIQKAIEEWEHSNGGFKMADEVLPGKPYLIQSGDDIVRAVVVGTGMNPGTFRCVCLDFNGVTECDYDHIYDLPLEFSISRLPTGLFLAKIHDLKWVDTVHINKVDTEIAKQNKHNVFECVPGFLFKANPGDLPELDWIHDSTEWFSVYLRKFDLSFDRDDRKRDIPLEINKIIDLVNNHIAMGKYAFVFSKHGHPRYPLKIMKFNQRYPMAADGYKSKAVVFNVNYIEQHEKSILQNGTTVDLSDVDESVFLSSEKISDGMHDLFLSPKEQNVFEEKILELQADDQQIIEKTPVERSSIGTISTILPESFSEESFTAVSLKQDNVETERMKSLYDFLSYSLCDAPTNEYSSAFKVSGLTLAYAYKHMLENMGMVPDEKMNVFLKKIQELVNLP